MRHPLGFAKAQAITPALRALHWNLPEEALDRELAHHEALYSGFAQRHFAKPAVRALREHMVGRILRVTGAGKTSRVLSLGCGIGDTELLLAPHVASITGIDLSPSAIRQARADAQQAGATNTEFLEAAVSDAALLDRSFDVIVGIFFLHHVPDSELRATAERIRGWLEPGGVFYGLDPSRYRLSGALGSLLVPHLMRRYQTPDERELKPSEVATLFEDAGFLAHARYYDFLSTPLAGLFPSWRAGYRAARLADEAIVRVPLLRALGSNFEMLARRPNL
jgi:2-polyprenyl-3-methyl-5-hydroxy-6-metoxy-1,4-benzoquinol methylase